MTSHVMAPPHPGTNPYLPGMSAHGGAARAPAPPVARSATLLVVDPSGQPLGSIGPLAVDVPWWSDAESLVAGARAACGAEVVVLRLIEADAPFGAPPAGGRVTYVVEAAPSAALVRRLSPWPHGRRLPDDPLRAPWARPGGPAADLAWADGVLAAAGTPRTGAASQVRTWNLSSLWRLPTAAGTVWLKAVPPFFAHEGPVLRALEGEAVPVVLAHDGHRSLLAEVPGVDGYDAPLDARLAMVGLLVDLQVRWADRIGELGGLGLPRWGRAGLVPDARRLAEGPEARGLGDAERRRLDRLVDGLDGRFEAVDRCGLPDTLVHGDFHGGNVRLDHDHLVLLDWGDSGLGHPLLDRPAFLQPLPPAQRPPLRRAWDAAWRAARPGSDPTRAAELIAPVAALRQALLYDRFLRSIEATERRYHEADVGVWLRRAAALAGS